MPRSAVIHSHSLDEPRMRSPVVRFGWSFVSTAASASTIASDDMSSTNVDADVTGMLRIGLSGVLHAGGRQASCGIRPDDAASLVDQVRGDERREEHALRADEGPDGDLPVVESRARWAACAAVRVASCAL